MDCKRSRTRALALAFGITNDFTVSVRLPWVRRTGILEGVQEDPADPAMVRDRGNTSGFAKNGRECQHERVSDLFCLVARVLLRV